jgi:hypothetical protein
MEDKKKLLNYVKNYQIPQNEIKNEDKHVIVPLQNDKTKHKVHKTDKKKSEKSKKISNKKEDKKEDKKEIKKKDYKKDSKKEDKKENRKESEHSLKRKKTIKDYDDLIYKFERKNECSKELIKRCENNILKYNKVYLDQENIIKNLELILSEQEAQLNNNNSPNQNNNKNCIKEEEDILNDILANDFNELDITECTEDDILYDDKFQEQLAINAVDQQIMDELYPNPDAMSYEQLLQLEDNMGNVNKGITKKQFDKLPKVKYNKEKYSENYQCIICMEEFEKNEKVKLLPCGHIFHDNCIKEWLMKQKSCPFCKSEIG